MKSAYRRVLLSHGDWWIDDVVVANTYRSRLIGLNLRGVNALLIRTTSIHTFTMRESIRVTSIAPDGRVGASLVMPPRRVVAFPEPVWVLESPVDIDGPPAGVVLRVLPSGFDVRDTHTLRHPDRESI